MPYYLDFDYLRMMAIKKSIKNKYDVDGYSVISKFLSHEECDELVEAGLGFTEGLEEMENKHVFSSSKHLKDKYFLESSDKMRPFFEPNALDEDGNLTIHESHALNKVGHALHVHHPIFRCYTFCQRMQEVCKYLGFKAPAVVQSMFIYKNAHVGSAVMPHQDSTFLYSEPTPVAGFWLSLGNSNTSNGCLWMARGSHRSGVHCKMIRNPDPNSEDLLIYDQPPPTYAEDSFQPVPLNKGSLVIIHGHVVHKSMANLSTRGRPAYTFHVVEMEDNTYSPDNWLQPSEIAPFENIYTTRVKKPKKNKKNAKNSKNSK